MCKESFEGFVRLCRAAHGQAALKYVRIMGKEGSMECFVFAGTFECDHLLFAPVAALDFDTLNFNTEAHPLKLPARESRGQASE